jgi:hypothetical protein
VQFENGGTAAALDVALTEQLDPTLDWSTLQLGSVGFGPVNLSIPVGLTQYQTSVSYQNTDGTPLNVQVALSFNVQTGLLTVTFTSLDPATGEAPTGVFDGFLPPDNQSGVGEGFVQYTIQPKAGLTTGAAITQQAAVVFDTNAPLSTAPVVNTIDAGPPTSSVSPLPGTESSANFTVSWSGQDDPGGSGIASFDVFVSDNGGPFTPFLTGTTQTSATFTGASGHRYTFFSVATDNVGNRQPTPGTAQATTQVSSLSRNGQFVVQAYQDLLGRPPDAAGLAYWTARLDQGEPRSTIAQLLDHSAEYFATIIRPAYRQFLGREGDAAGLAYWTARMQQGLTDEQLQAGFIGSPEFFQHSGGTNKSWVDAMYLDLLGRPPDTAGENYWVGQLAAGANRAAVAYGFAASLEREAERVQEDYLKYLGRRASDAEVSYWVTQFKNGLTNEDVVTGFVGSAEYFNTHTHP